MNACARPNYHILLIEDNSGDAMLFREVLSKSRFNTVCDHVSNGEDALDFLYRRGDYLSAPKPDLVLMDLTLPRLDGLDLLKIIKNDLYLKSIPVVIFTGSDRPEDIKMAYMAGSNGYVTKPIGLSQLEQAVKIIEEYWFGTNQNCPARE